MTTMITTLGKDYSVKALATDVGGKLFVRATIAMETSNLVTIDEEVVSSFADARDNALAAAIQIVNRMAESASSVTDGVRTDEKNETTYYINLLYIIGIYTVYCDECICGRK